MATQTPVKKPRKDNSRRNAAVAFSVTLLGYAAIAGLHSLSDFLLGGGIALAAGGLVKVMTTPMKGLDAPSTSDGIRTEQVEDDYARSTVIAGLDLLEQLRKQRDGIRETEFTQRINAFADAYADLLNRVVADHNRAADLRKLNSYYLPTVINLLQSYRNAKGRSTENTAVTQTREDLLRTLDQLITAAQKLQQRMVKANLENMDIKIEVLEDILRSDGYIENEETADMRISAEKAAKSTRKPTPGVVMEPVSAPLQSSAPTATAQQLQQGAPVLHVPGLLDDEPQAEEENSAMF